jgi:hypothetical protein
MSASPQRLRGDWNTLSMDDDGSPEREGDGLPKETDEIHPGETDCDTEGSIMPQVGITVPSVEMSRHAPTRNTSTPPVALQVVSRTSALRITDHRQHGWITIVEKHVETARTERTVLLHREDRLV